MITLQDYSPLGDLKPTAELGGLIGSPSFHTLFLTDCEGIALPPLCGLSS